MLLRLVESSSFGPENSVNNVFPVELWLLQSSSIFQVAQSIDTVGSTADRKWIPYKTLRFLILLSDFQILHNINPVNK